MASSIYFTKGALNLYFTHDPTFPHVKIQKVADYHDFMNKGFHFYKMKEPPTTFFILKFKYLTATCYTNFLTFLRDSTVRYSRHTFTYTDVDGGTHTVRYMGHRAEWTKGISCSEGSTIKLYDLDITLRKE